MALIDYTDEQLLIELIRRNGYEDAPSKPPVRHGEWYETEIGIGDDYSAFVSMSAEDMAALRDGVQ